MAAIFFKVDCFTDLYFDFSDADCSGKTAMGLHGVARMASGTSDGLVTSIDVTDTVYAHHFSCFMLSKTIREFLTKLRTDLGIPSKNVNGSDAY